MRKGPGGSIRISRTNDDIREARMTLHVMNSEVTLHEKD